MKGFCLRLRSLKYKDHLHKTQSTKQSFICFAHLQYKQPLVLTLDFNHQHLGTFQSSLPYKKFLCRKKLVTLKLTLLYIQQYPPYTERFNPTYSNTYVMEL